MKLHEQAEQYILKSIENGTYRPGDRIPPETELAKTLSVSRPTVRQALTKLVSDGRLVRVKGKGTFITEPKLLHLNTSMISSYKSECRNSGLSVQTRVTDFQIISASPQLDGQKAVRLSRIRFSEEKHAGRPLVYTTIYFPLELLEDAEAIDFGNVSFYEIMKARGHEIVHTKKRLEVMQPDPYLAGMLNISTYEPIIFITTRGYVQSGRLAEFSESYYPSSISSFDIELHHKEQKDE